VLKGKEMIIELANDKIKEVWGRGNDIEGKSLLEIMPELKILHSTIGSTRFVPLVFLSWC
jgi:hypothetical protein